MAPPNAAPNNLPSTFHYAGWTIKYTLLSHPTLHHTDPPPTNPKTLVFIHGTPWSSTVFQPLIQSLLSSPQFSKTYRILLYDMPGYGQSQLPYPTTSYPTTTNASSHRDFKDNQNDTSVATQAQTLRALLAHLKIKNPAVLAHDIGGAIALRAHLILGVGFERMMLLDSNAVLPWGDGFYALARAEPGVFARLPAHVFEAVVRSVVRSASVTAHGLEGGWEEALMGPWVGSTEAQESFVRQIAQAEDGDVAEMFADGGDECLYGRVRCGVSVLWGSKDSWIPREKMERLCGLLGERLERFVVVEDAGHLLMLDQPERVDEEVRRWLSVE
jgi:pimeloyl-ACP methyl ester carboxylesterase